MTALLALRALQAQVARKGSTVPKGPLAKLARQGLTALMALTAGLGQQELPALREQPGLLVFPLG